ncbi:hypothetical protein [Psychrobacter ciconiae]|uniref:hypothetical protein n=1 Tax=Psychrobacter ciconiae TaxID=1553449 RepID=UPI001660CC4C|nr:hypothetical protein [Psychrobacter ciconiae]
MARSLALTSVKSGSSWRVIHANKLLAPLQSIKADPSVFDAKSVDKKTRQFQHGFILNRGNINALMATFLR